MPPLAATRSNLERQYERPPAAPNANLERISGAQKRRALQIWSARSEQQSEARGVDGIKRTPHPKHETTLGTCFLNGARLAALLEGLEGARRSVSISLAAAGAKRNRALIVLRYPRLTKPGIDISWVSIWHESRRLPWDALTGSFGSLMKPPFSQKVACCSMKSDSGEVAD